MSADKTVTMDGVEVVENLVVGLSKVEKTSISPGLLKSRHQRGLCLGIADHYVLVHVVADNRGALETKGITFNRYRPNGETKLICDQRECLSR